MTQDENAVIYLANLARMEDEGETAELHVGPYTIFLMISCIQVACRHPMIPGELVAQMRDMGEQLGQLFTGTPGESLIVKGWDLDEDISLYTGNPRDTTRKLVFVGGPYDGTTRYQPRSFPVEQMEPGDPYDTWGPSYLFPPNMKRYIPETEAPDDKPLETIRMVWGKPRITKA